MLRYQNIIFDLDGTLSNPAEGIYNGLKYAFTRMNFKCPADFDFASIIGLPLQDSLKQFFKSDKEVWEAVNQFREYYCEKGLFENALYENVPALLKKLKSSGASVFIATNKPQPFADKITDYFDIIKYFNLIKGIDPSVKVTGKEELVREIMDCEKITDLKSVVLVGDTHHDVLCGQHFKMDTVAVTYGFGKREDLLRSNPSFLVGSVKELSGLLLKTPVYVAL